MVFDIDITNYLNRSQLKVITNKIIDNYREYGEGMIDLD
jgi:hypothetical protein